MPVQLTHVIHDNMVSIGDINQFANPRHALESQGIPVTRAASKENESNETPERSVVIPGMEDSD